MASITIMLIARTWFMGRFELLTLLLIKGSSEICPANSVATNHWTKESHLLLTDTHFHRNSGSTTSDPYLFAWGGVGVKIAKTFFYQVSFLLLFLLIFRGLRRQKASKEVNSQRLLTSRLVKDYGASVLTVKTAEQVCLYCYPKPLCKYTVCQVDLWVCCVRDLLRAYR